MVAGTVPVSWKRGLSVAAAAVLVAASLSVWALPARAGYTVHSPILIEGNAAFTAANGVTGGSGTAADPYLIASWSIDASAADGIVVRNTTAPFRIQAVLVSSGGYTHDGIVLDNVSWGTIENATATQDATGIVLRGSANVTVEVTTVLLNNFNGIRVEACADVFANGNSVSQNNDGFSLHEVQRMRLVGNSVWMNRQDGVYALGLTNASFAGGTFGSNAWSGLEIQGGANVTVSVNQFLSNGRQGLTIASVDGLVVSSNTASANPGGGAQLNGVANATVQGNRLSPAGASGLLVQSARDLRITGNSISQANYSGIILGVVVRATLASNLLSNNEVGVGGVNVSDLQIRSNKIGANTDDGVSLIGARNVTVEGNNVSRNAAGVVLDSLVGGLVGGNVLWQNGVGVQLLRSTGIVVANNSFLFNAPQGSDDGMGTNAWDAGYPAGGNYWSDYYGIDLCAGPKQNVCISPDGFGDTPYPVSGNRVDHYPLMRQPGTSPQLPVAAFVVSPIEGNTSTVFVFNASASYDLQDPAGALLVRWDLNGDGVWDTPWTTNRTATYRFTEPGSYAVRLAVLDLSGLMSGRVQTVYVVAVPPPVSPFVALLPWLILLGVVSTAAAVYVYRWDRARRLRVGHPAWRLPPGPPK